MNIIEPSDHRTRWRLHLVEFDFDIKYKKGNKNKLANTMCRLQITGETEVGDDEDIPSLHIARPTRRSVPDLENDILDEEDTNETTAFIEQEFDEEDQLLLAQEIPAYAKPPFSPITWEELISFHLHDAFYSKTRRRLEREWCYRLKLMINNSFFRTIQAPKQILVSHNLKKKVLHANHHALLAGLPGGRNLPPDP